MKSRQAWIKWALPTALVMLFGVSIIPVLRISFFDFAMGDDLGYGTLTHIAWVNEGTLSAVLKAVCETIRNYYYSWQGTWFTIAIMSLQPEVFSPGAYWITAWIMLAITIGAVTLIMYEFVGKHLQLPTWAWISVDMLALIAIIQFYPSTASGIFWFNGGAHYVIPFGIAMVAVWAILEYRKDRKIRNLIITIISMTALGGSSYLMPVFVIVVLAYLSIYDWVTKEQKVMWPMLIPLFCEIVGLVISFLSPGNKNRGGEEFGFSVLGIVTTIGKSFIEALLGIKHYLITYSVVTVLLVAMGLVSFYAFRESKVMMKFRKPWLFVLTMFCLYTAMYTPGIYAGVEVSGGVPNTIYQVYILTSTLSVIYFSGWLAFHFGKVVDKKMIVIYGMICLVCFMILVSERSSIKKSTFYRSLDYAVSGRGADFRAQMQYNQKILLDPNIKEAYLCPINDNQDPFMSMPVGDDPTMFPNKVNREFYQKDYVGINPSLSILAE